MTLRNHWKFAGKYLHHCGCRHCQATIHGWPNSWTSDWGERPRESHKEPQWNLDFPYLSFLRYVGVITETCEVPTETWLVRWVMFTGSQLGFHRFSQVRSEARAPATAGRLQCLLWAKWVRRRSERSTSRPCRSSSHRTSFSCQST